MNLFDFFSLRRDDEVKCNQTCNLYHFSYCINNVLFELGPALTKNKSSKIHLEIILIILNIIDLIVNRKIYRKWI